MNKPSRLEKDSLGSIEVESSHLWGAQTQRSLNNFAIGKDLIPIKIIYSLALIKKSAAITNNKLGLISDKKKDLLLQVQTLNVHH